MNVLSRIFARTPSLRTRVVLATAIGAAIPVLIVGVVVWVGITNDRKERLDRRLDEAAGFAIPFVPRGIDEIPRSPNDQDALITVRRADLVKSNSNITLPKLEADYADTYIHGVRYRVRTVDIPGPGPTSMAVGATYDATIAETNNLHRRVLLICGFAISAAAVFAWLLAAFAVRPFKQLAQQTRSIDAGDEAPRVEVHGASEAVEIAEAMRGMLQRIWDAQNRTMEALASARDFAAVSSHELRTPLTAMRTNLEVLATLDLPEDQRKEVLSDVIRTQSRIEATLSALERLAQGELSTSDDHVPGRHHRAARPRRPRRDADLPRTRCVPGAVADLHHRRIAGRIAPRRRQRDRQRRQTRRRHAGPAVCGQLTRRGGNRGRRQRQRSARRRASRGVRAILARIDGLAFGVGSGTGIGGPASAAARRYGLAGEQPAGRRAAAAGPARPELAALISSVGLPLLLRALAPRREIGPLR